MTSAKHDWRYILDGTLMPGLSLAVAMLILGACLWFYDRESRRYEIYSANQAAIHEDYDALVYRRRLVARYHQRYRDLQDLGFVGRENRLDWIETIRLAAKGLDLPNVAYSLEPQLEVIRPVESTSPDAEIQIYLSKLDLELGLVHEVDLRLHALHGFLIERVAIRRLRKLRLLGLGLVLPPGLLGLRLVLVAALAHGLDLGRKRGRVGSRRSLAVAKKSS